MNKIFLAATVAITLLLCSACDSSVSESPVFGKCLGITAKAYEELKPVMEKAFAGDEDAATKLEKETESKYEPLMEKVYKELLNREVPCEVEKDAPLKMGGTLKVKEAEDMMKFVFSGCTLVTTEDLKADDNETVYAIFVDKDGKPVDIQWMYTYHRFISSPSGSDIIKSGQKKEVELRVRISIKDSSKYAYVEKIVFGIRNRSSLIKQYEEMKKEQKKKAK